MLVILISENKGDHKYKERKTNRGLMHHILEISGHAPIVPVCLKVCGDMVIRNINTRSILPILSYQQRLRSSAFCSGRYINDAVGAGDECRRIRCQVNRKIVKLINVAKSSLRRHTLPYFLLGIESWHLVQCSVHVTW